MNDPNSFIFKNTYLPGSKLSPCYFYTWHILQSIIRLFLYCIIIINLYFKDIVSYIGIIVVIRIHTIWENTNNNEQKIFHKHI